MSYDNPSLNRIDPTCNPNPSRQPRRFFADSCQRSLHDSSRNYTPNDRSCPTSKLEGRSLSISMEVERDKQIACERYRNYSAKNRTHNPELYLSSNGFPNAFSYSPANLGRQPLNVAAEIQRGRRLALGRPQVATATASNRRVSPQARTNLPQGTSQYSGMISDSVAGNAASNKSYDFLTSTPKVDRSIIESPLSSNSPINKLSGTPQYSANAPMPTRATPHHTPLSPTRAISPTHGVAAPRHEQDFNATVPYPQRGKTITRTVVTTKTTRTIPPQNNRHFLDDSFREHQEQRDTSPDVHKALLKDQSPAIGTRPQSTFNTSQLLSVSSLATSQVSQNPMQCPTELFNVHHDPLAITNETFGAPVAESTGYNDIDERKCSHVENDSMQLRPQLRYNATAASKLQPDEFASDTAAAGPTASHSFAGFPPHPTETTKSSRPPTAAPQGGFFTSPELTREQGALESYRTRSYPVPLQQQYELDSMNASGLNALNRIFMVQCNNDEFSQRQVFDRSRRSEVPQSNLECAEAKRCGRIQFHNSDNYETQTIQEAQMRRNQIEMLVVDNYCPGVIQETLEGKKNFNSVSFNISFGANLSNLHSDDCNSTPLHDPMTLLEAFALRIERESSEINKELPEEAQEIQIKETVNKHFGHRNPSDLNRCIKSLLLSEHIDNAISTEKSKSLSFTADIHRNVTVFTAFNSPIKLIAYTGRTKPVEMPE